MSFNGNYTGYSVNSVDVFLWVLLTVGSIGFPVVVLTVCCLKKRYETQKIEHEYLYADPTKKKILQKNLERGFLGPYAESKESIIESKPQNKIPEIIIQPYNLGGNNKVRFKDDTVHNQDTNQLPALMSAIQEGDQDVQHLEPNTADLRGLKNAVNFFGKNLANKKQSFSNRSEVSGTQYQADRYVQNPIQQANEENFIYSSASQLNPADPVMYSTASSQGQIGIQGTLSQATNLVPENIYSQVIPQNRNHNPANIQDNFDSYDDQPVYMNTGQIDGQYDQYEAEVTPPRKNGNWDDSSV